MRGFCSDWKADPGPCPVDDTPHTACTPESVAAQRARQTVVITVQRPRVLDVQPVTFTTKTYSRAKHGRRTRVV